jgi:hypothetical protein
VGSDELTQADCWPSISAGTGPTPVVTNKPRDDPRTLARLTAQPPGAAPGTSEAATTAQWHGDAIVDAGRPQSDTASHGLKVDRVVAPSRVARQSTSSQVRTTERVRGRIFNRPPLFCGVDGNIPIFPPPLLDRNNIG